VKVFLSRPEGVRGAGGIVKLPQLLLAGNECGTDGFGAYSLRPHATKCPADDRSDSQEQAYPDHTNWRQIIE
jgi:hypothetical protein